MSDKTAEQIAEEILAKAKGKTNGEISPPHVERGEGAALLDDVRRFSPAVCCLPVRTRTRRARPLARAHALDVGVESTPRIAFLSPEPASGKTRSMEVSGFSFPIRWQR